MNTNDDGLTFSSLFIPLTPIKAVCFIFLIGTVLFFNSFFNGFVGDDDAQIGSNVKIHSLANLGNFFLEDRLRHSDEQRALGATYYKPMLDSSFAFLYAIFGENPFGFHLIQVILFIINSCLVFFLFKKFFRLELAFCLALLFLIHPATSEDAIYISALQEVLFTFFGLLSLLALSKSSSLKDYILIGFGLLLAIFSKEAGVLYLFASFLYGLLYKRKQVLSLIAVLVVVFGSYLIFRFHAIGFQKDAFINAPIQGLSLGERLLTLPAVIFFYFKIFFFPYYLSSSYQWVYKSLDFNRVILPFFVDSFISIVVFYFGYFLRKREKKLFKVYVFFASWLLLGLGLHSQILPLDQTVAERWFYFPVIGLLGLIGIFWEYRKIKFDNRIVITSLVVIFILLSLRTFLRTFDYRDDFTLATHDLAVSPESYNLEYIVSHIYYQQGKLDEAQKHAEKSVGLFPYITNYTNLGAIYSRLGNYQKAKESYLKALEYGEDRLPYENLSSLALVDGNREENIWFIKNKALKSYPTDGKIWLNLAMLEYMERDSEGANYDLAQASKYTKDPMIAFLRNLVQSKKTLEVKADKGQIQFVIGD